MVKSPTRASSAGLLVLVALLFLVGDVNATNTTTAAANSSTNASATTTTAAVNTTNASTTTTTEAPTTTTVANVTNASVTSTSASTTTAAPNTTAAPTTEVVSSTSSSTTTASPNTTVAPNATTTMAANGTTVAPATTSSANETNTTWAPDAGNSTNAPDSTNTSSNATNAPSATTSAPQPPAGPPTAPSDAITGSYTCTSQSQTTTKQDLSFLAATTVSITGCSFNSLSFYKTAPGAQITITGAHISSGGIYVYDGLSGRASLSITNTDITDPTSSGTHTALVEVWGNVSGASTVTIANNYLHTEQSRFTAAIRLAATDSSTVTITSNTGNWINSDVAALFNVTADTNAKVFVTYNRLSLAKCRVGTFVAAAWVSGATYQISHNIFTPSSVANFVGLTVSGFRSSSKLEVMNNTIVADKTGGIVVATGLSVVGGGSADILTQASPSTISIKANVLNFQYTSSSVKGIVLIDVHNVADAQIANNSVSITSNSADAVGIAVYATPFPSSIVATLNMDVGVWNFNALYESNTLVVLGVTSVGIGLAPTYGSVTRITRQILTVAGVVYQSQLCTVYGIVFYGAKYNGNTAVAGGVRSNLTLVSNSITTTRATLTGVIDFIAGVYTDNGGSMLQQSFLNVSQVAFAQLATSVSKVVGMNFPGVGGGSTATIASNSVVVQLGDPAWAAAYVLGAMVGTDSNSEPQWASSAASASSSSLTFSLNYGEVVSAASNPVTVTSAAMLYGVCLGASTGSGTSVYLFNNVLRSVLRDGPRPGSFVAVKVYQVASSAIFRASRNVLNGSTPSVTCICSVGAIATCTGSILPPCSSGGFSFTSVGSNAYVLLDTNEYLLGNTSQAVGVYVQSITGGAAFLSTTEQMTWLQGQQVTAFSVISMDTATLYVSGLSVKYTIMVKSDGSSYVPQGAGAGVSSGFLFTSLNAGASVNVTTSRILSTNPVLTTATLLAKGISIVGGAGSYLVGSSSNRIDAMKFMDAPALPGYAMTWCDQTYNGGAITSTAITSTVTLLTCYGATSGPSQRTTVMTLSVTAAASFNAASFAVNLAKTLSLAAYAVIVTSATATTDGTLVVAVQFQLAASALAAEKLTATQKNALGIVGAAAATDPPTTAPPPPAVGGDNIIALVVGLTVGTVVMLGLGLVVARTMGSNDDKRRKALDAAAGDAPLNPKKNLNAVLHTPQRPATAQAQSTTINLDDDLL